MKARVLLLVSVLAAGNLWLGHVHGQGPAAPAKPQAANAHVVSITEFMAPAAVPFPKEEPFLVRLIHRVPYLRTMRQPPPPRMPGPITDITAGIPDSKK